MVCVLPPWRGATLEKPPLLALHGWLDNAASFAPLASRLADTFYVVALDLSGHGRSDWRSADATYQVYDDLPQIRSIVEQLGWSSFALMGHSRGAVIASLFAAAFPELVTRLVLLDGVASSSLEAEGYVEQMRRFVVDKERLLQRKYRVFKTEQEAVTVREEQGLDRASAELIALRNLRVCEGGLTWSTDPRLRGASAVKDDPGTDRRDVEVPCYAQFAVGGEGGAGGAASESFCHLARENA